MVNMSFFCRPSLRMGLLRKLITTLVTWFRCLVKLIYSQRATNGLSIDYKWHEIGVFTRWDSPNCCRILCADAPEAFRLDLKISLEKMSTLDLRDPFCMHAPLLDEMVKLYDQSLWLLRDAVRAIEKVHFFSCSRGNYCADECPFVIEQSRNRNKFREYERLVSPWSPCHRGPGGDDWDISEDTGTAKTSLRLFAS